MARIMKFVAVAGLVLVAACGSDSDSESSSSTTTGGDAGNACPVENCSVTISDVVTSGEELEITWETNFDPDVSRNHVHVYWSTFSPAEVSADAESVHGVTQGTWVPTDANPNFITEGAVSMTVRGDAEEVCVTAADRDHNVLDVDVQDCFDVSDLVA
ncbi:MAG: hypothetical protein ACR2QE_13715 [Acidimicrobiales bacterium]